MLNQPLFRLIFDKFIFKKLTAMKTKYNIYSYRFVILLLLFGTFSLNSQEDSKILGAYKDYTNAAREVVYLHLNKSTYIKGEFIGFTAYVMDKKEKKPSLLTTNLYVSIEDENKTVVKKKLIRVVDGVASNTFEVDSLFNSGYYHINAYTNWMLNFNEKNYFTESIKIIDLQDKDFNQVEKTDNQIDAQFLPESGHLLNGVVNIIGVAIKDQLGFGIPYAKGYVVDKNNVELSSFETNEFGIGKFQLLPDIENAYHVKINYADKDFSFDLNQEIERNGIILSLKKLKSKVFLSVKTNEETLESIKNKRHTLMIHNGDYYEIMDIYFTDTTEITRVIDNSNTPSGINILTLFNENDKPISERLFFNYEGINLIEPSTMTSAKQKDSMTINLNFKAINPSFNTSISVSVLPEDSKSYNSHNNIISYTYLEPYVNGIIEKAKYYFTNIDAKKQYELDNLLITQGWSSYSWNDIFQKTQIIKYPFEQGITIKANLTSKDSNDELDSNYLMHAVNNETPRVLSIKKGEKSFVIENFFPEGTQPTYISKMTESEGLKPASLYLQFFPNDIPPLNNPKMGMLTYNKEKLEFTKSSYKRSNLLTNTEELEEVVVESSPFLDKRFKENGLNTGDFGNITVIDEQDENTFIKLTDYIQNKFFSENMRYKNSNDSSFLTQRFTINYFLDDVLLTDLGYLEGMFLSDIESIEFNRFGVGDGFRSPNGFVKIYSKKFPIYRYDSKTTKAYNFPLTFSPNKTFYTPKYKYYNDAFYKKYGVVAWESKLVPDSNGNVNIKIAKPKVPITLYMEGIANNGSFISEEKTIALD